MLGALAARGAAAWANFRRDLTPLEVSGSLGDLGTFLPLVVGLVQAVGLDFGSTLIITGLYNIATGLHFGIPMCVQPMKTIAAVALSVDPISLDQVLYAGLFVSSVVLLLGVTRLMEVFNRIVPLPVVRGMQLALGIKLATKGVTMAVKEKSAGGLAWRAWGGVDGLALGLFALVFLLLATIASKQPEEGQGGGEPRSSGSAAGRPHASAAGEAAALAQPLLHKREERDASRDSDAASAQQRQGTTTFWAHDSGVSNQPGQPSGEQPDAAHGSSSSRCSAEEALQPEAQLAGDSSCPDGMSSAYCSTRASDSSDGSCGKRKCKPAAAERIVVVVGGQQSDGTDQEQEEERESSKGKPYSKDVRALPPAAASPQPQQQQQQDPLQTVPIIVPACCTTDPAQRPSVPAALVIVVLGIILTLASQPGIAKTLSFGPSTPRLLRPSWENLKEGVLRAGIPQLPLTALNSVVAVTALARQLYPQHDPRDFSSNAIATCVGLMNVLGAWFGCVPACHGSGGLAAQVKFGARSGAAPIALGLMKVLLGLLFGSSLYNLLRAFPQTLLGAMLVLSGVELACTARGERTARGYTFLLLTAAGVLALDDTSQGFVMGVAAVVAVNAWERAGLPALAWLQARLRLRRRRASSSGAAPSAVGAATAAAAGRDRQQQASLTTPAA